MSGRCRPGSWRCCSARDLRARTRRPRRWRRADPGGHGQGVVPTRAELDRDFFETRFARATEAGRYLAAMAALGDGPVARQGGWRTPASAGPVRQTLIEKGLIYSPDRGLVAFTVPHFADFVQRRDREYGD